MFEPIPIRYLLFFVLYGGAAVVSAVLCLYLLLRRGNAFSAHTTPPLALRRWAAAFYGIGALGHVWWLLFYIFFREEHSAAFVVVVVLDSVTLLVTIFGTLLAMLQDRKRPFWPIALSTVPIVILGVLQIARPATDFLTPCIVYMLAVYVLFTLYVVVAVRQYGRWLRENYADLEHKEVRFSLALIIMLLLAVMVYESASDDPSFLLIRIVDLVMFGLLLWRVETLPTLTPNSSPKAEEGEYVQEQEAADEVSAPLSLRRGPGDEAIEQLLTEHCVQMQLYLQHDLTLASFSTAVGVNRTYLSQYFSRLGLNYNTYINGLRIDHFIRLYREAVASNRHFTVMQLTQDSGFRSYSTFSSAFKQRMGQSLRAWMRETSD